MTDRELLEKLRDQLVITENMLATLSDAVAKQLATATPTPPAPASGSLTILTWNAHHGGQRTDGVVDMVGFSNWVAKMTPDVACHQEMDVASSPALLDRILGQTTKAHWDSVWSGRRGNSIHTFLQNRHDMITTAEDEGRGLMPFVAVTVGGRELSIMCAHLDAYVSGKRLREINEAMTVSLPAIWCGDFNCAPSSPEYQAIIGYGYVDAWIAAESRTNYPGNCDGCTKGGRIDYVFVHEAAKLRVSKAEIIDTRDGKGVLASDHKPLLVTLEW